jgi:hypothetical protein
MGAGGPVGRIGRPPLLGSEAKRKAKMQFETLLNYDLQCNAQLIRYEFSKIACLKAKYPAYVCDKLRQTSKFDFLSDSDRL